MAVYSFSFEYLFGKWKEMEHVVIQIVCSPHSVELDEAQEVPVILVFECYGRLEKDLRTLCVERIRVV